VVDETYNVFVSYSRADGRHAADIDSVLRDKGLNPFFDRRNLAPGLPWVRALEQAIGAAKAVIVLLGPRGFGNTQQYERELAFVRQTRDPAFPIVPVILPETTTDPPFDFLRVLTWIDFSHVTRVSDAPDVLEQLLRAIHGKVTSAETARDAICPYRGLDAFREEDAAFFFGRGSADDPNSAIGELVSNVRKHPFVMLVGRSGSGKSSLVYAGLLPALRRERDRFWNVLALRPGPTPLRALAAAFNPRADNEGAAEYATKITNEADKLRTGDPELLSHMICEELDRAEGGPDRLLLYVDQWEELYAQAPPSSDEKSVARHAADRNRFIDLLLTASRTAPVVVVGTVRADFYDPLISHHEIKSLLPTRQVLLGKMLRSELERTIIEPARKVGLTFDPPSLVQRILDEAGEDEGMLPLLQYALKESWALRKSKVMTADSYARSGGVREAIKITAERTFEALSAADQQAARQLFLRLVIPGEGQEDTRVRAAMPSEPAQRKIVDQFSGPRTRLLVTGSDRDARPTVEVAHEALIRTWSRLRGWIDDNREKLRARAAVLQVKAEWEKQGRREDLLLPAGFQLERARELIADPGDLTVEDIQEFIFDSIKRNDDERNAREKERLRYAAALAREEDHSRALGIMADSVRMPRRHNGAADSLAMALTNKRPDLPNVTEYVEALYNGLGQLRERRRIEIPTGFAKQTFALSFAPSGKLLAAAVPDNLLFYDTSTGELVHSVGTRAGWVMSLRWSPDGKRIYVGTSPLGLILSPSTIGKLRKYFPDGGEDECDLSVIIGSEEHPAGVGVWSHDSKSMLVAAWQRHASIWDAAKGRFRKLIEDNGWENPLDSLVGDIAVSADGKRIAIGAASGRIHVFNARARARAGFSLKLEKSLDSLNNTNPMPYSLVFDPQNHDRLFAGYMASPIMALWKIDEDSVPILYADDESGPVWRVAYDPEGKFVASASNDSVVRIWASADSDSAVQLRGHLGSVFTVDISPENSNVASGSFDGTIRLWSKDSPLSPTLLPNSTFMPAANEFSVQGSQISVTADGGQIYWGTLPQEFGEPIAAAVSANGAGIAVVPQSGRPVLLANFRDCQTPVSVTLPGVKSEWAAVAFIEDGTSIAANTKEGKIFAWTFYSDVHSLEQLAKQHLPLVQNKKWGEEAT
jgi:WD40 repeat protein/energy-coupling factor transporter ATP-binding protein EcfA2